MRRIPVLILLCSLVAGGAWAQHSYPEPPEKTPPLPGCRFDAEGVTAPRLTAGAKAYFSGEVLDTAYYVLDRERPAGIAVDTDNDGVARFDTPLSTVSRAVWLVVDDASGDYVIGTPFGFVRRRMTLAAGAVQSDRLSVARRDVDVTLVRPGVGMWKGRYTDGTTDGDGAANGVTVINFSTLTPVGTSPAAPATLAANDILFAADANTLEFFVTRRAQQP